MKKKRVLFICHHNSARSQLAEEILKKYGGDIYAVESAGLEEGDINPYVARVLLEEEGVDISNKATRNVKEILYEGHVFWEIITVCGVETHEKCPIFPGIQHRYHWDYPDPSKYTGTDEEKMEKVKALYLTLKERILEHFHL